MTSRNSRSASTAAGPHKSFVSSTRTRSAAKRTELLDKAFALNFTLYNKAMDEQGRDAFVKTGQVQEDCWSGTQPRKVLAAAGG